MSPNPILLAIALVFVAIGALLSRSGLIVPGALLIGLAVAMLASFKMAR
jgi:hypothetical protein